jgi:lysyl-tRNA synthetase, class II
MTAEARKVPTVVRFERHPLGPRVFVLGRRVHEYELGVIFLAGATGLGLGDLLHGVGLYALSFAGLWMVVKDWRDMTPKRRDTGAWRVGLHRAPRPLRREPRGTWVPPAAAAIAAFVAVLNLVSTLTPNVGWRGHLLRRWAPFGVSPVFHALALPAAVALLAAAFYLARRRYRALQIAVALLLALGTFDLLKGLDFEEAAVSWATAAALWASRRAFVVQPAPMRPRRSLALAVLLLAAVVGSMSFAVWVTAPGRPHASLVARETLDLLLWRRGPIRFRDEFSGLPIGVGIVSLVGMLTIAWLVLRPLPAPRTLPTGAARSAAQELVRAYGRDTLAFFKLRLDKQYLFSGDRRAFLGYRIENGVLLVSGDPVGEAAAVPPLIGDALALADRHDLRFAAIGASSALLPVYRDAGLRVVYLGDEAILDTRSFSLEGRRIRKVRQSVLRLEKAGYTVLLLEHGDLDEHTLAELEEVSTAWRAGADERGFSMAMEGIRGVHQAGSVIVLARDPQQRVGGYLHFVPTFDRRAMSLAAMRRSPTAPNGLTEYMVVRSIQLFRDRSIDELSLNFAAFGRLLRDPKGRRERVLAFLLRRADRFFQIERVASFSAKFDPRWEPRYLVLDGWTAAPRTVLAALWAEGQAPRPPRLRGASTAAPGH